MVHYQVGLSAPYKGEVSLSCDQIPQAVGAIVDACHGGCPAL